MCQTTELDKAMDVLLRILIIFMLLYMVYITISSIWEAGGRTILGSIMFVAMMWAFCALLNTTIVQALIACCFLVVIVMLVLQAIACFLSSMISYINKLFNHE